MNRNRLWVIPWRNRPNLAYRASPLLWLRASIALGCLRGCRTLQPAEGLRVVAENAVADKIVLNGGLYAKG